MTEHGIPLPLVHSAREHGKALCGAVCEQMDDNLEQLTCEHCLRLEYNNRLRMGQLDDTPPYLSRETAYDDIVLFNKAGQIIGKLGTEAFLRHLAEGTLDDVRAQFLKDCAGLKRYHVLLKRADGESMTLNVEGATARRAIDAAIDEMERSYPEMGDDITDIHATETWMVADQSDCPPTPTD